MKKNRVRLTEAQLHQVIKESVKNVLSELDYKTLDKSARQQMQSLNYPKGKEYDKYRDPRKARAEKFSAAAMDKFKNEFGYEEGEYPNINRVIPYTNINGDTFEGIDVINGDDVMTYHPDGTLTSDSYDFYEPGYEGDRGGLRATSTPRNKDEFFKGEDNALRRAFDRATSEWENYRNGNYEYEPNGRGWHLKDNMDESIRRAIRKVLR